MRDVIYWRTKEFKKDELPAASKYFDCTDSILDLRAGDRVICRYSSLPFYREVCEDFKRIGATPLNNYNEHRYIADLREWYDGLKEFTPKTWFDLSDIPSDPDCRYFIKGETNSKKFLFNTHAYAKGREQATEVYLRLSHDGLIEDQKIYFREFEDFETWDYGLNGLPIINEWRSFIVNGKIVVSGYYWSNFYDDLLEAGKLVNQLPIDGQAFLQEISSKLSEVGQANGYCIDIAKRADGVWRLIELNCITMSGLSCIDPDDFYRNLKECLPND